MRLDWIDCCIAALVGYGVARMIADRKHIEYTRRLIERLRMLYFLQTPTLPDGKPLSFEQLERLLKHVAIEGYAL